MEIKRKFLGLDKEHKMFFQVFQEHTDKCRELIGKDYTKVTISRFDTCLKYFREMCVAQYQRKDIPLKEVTNGMIHDYIHFLKAEKGLQENTVPLYEGGKESTKHCGKLRLDSKESIGQYPFPRKEGTQRVPYQRRIRNTSHKRI